MTDAVQTEKKEQEIVQTKGHVMDVASSVLAVELPCGYVDPEGAVQQELVVAEMTGYEEDLLAGKGPILQRLNQIILNCTRRLGTIEDRGLLNKAVSALTASDRMVALLAIRRVSLGDLYEVKLQCPNTDCKEEVRYTLNLADVEVKAMADPTKRVFEHTLSSGRQVTWHVMTSADEEWLTRAGKKREDVLTLALLSRVDMVEDQAIDRAKDYKAAMARLKALSTRDRNEIRSLFEQCEGHVDTVVDFSCPSCQHEWRDELSLGQASFFFPSAT